MRKDKRAVVLGAALTLAGAAVAAACVSNSNNGPSGIDGGAGFDGAAPTEDGGALADGSKAGTDGSTPGTDGSAPGDGGAASDGSGFAVTGSVTLPGFASAMAYNPTTDELWVTSQGTDDAGVNAGTVTIVDGTSFTVKSAALTEQSSFAGFTGVVVAPDLNKGFVANTSSLDGGGARGEIDMIDGVTHAATLVASFAADLESSVSLAYDPIAHRVYASVSGGYLYVIDAAAGTLLSTLPKTLVSGAGLSGFGQVTVDPTGTELFLLTGDVNSYPMVATFPLDGGAVGSVLGGQAAGWEIAVGPPALLTDGGGAGVPVQLSDGGSFLQVFDPATIALVPGDSPLAIGTVRSTGQIAVAVIDSCGKKRLRFFDPGTGFQLDTFQVYASVDTNYVLRNIVQIDKTAPAGTLLHFAAIAQPAPGDSVDPSTKQIFEVTLDTSAAPAPPCP
jgi:hypothetical protein